MAEPWKHIQALFVRKDSLSRPELRFLPWLWLGRGDLRRHAAAGRTPRAQPRWRSITLACTNVKSAAKRSLLRQPRTV